MRLIVTYGFPWAEENISNNFSTSGGEGETECLVFGGILTSNSLVDILEDFVETELSESLETISNEGEFIRALSGADLSGTFKSGFVESRVSLFTALNNIKRGR